MKFRVIERNITEYLDTNITEKTGDIYQIDIYIPSEINNIISPSYALLFVDYRSTTLTSEAQDILKELAKETPNIDYGSVDKINQLPFVEFDYKEDILDLENFSDVVEFYRKII